MKRALAVIGEVILMYLAAVVFMFWKPFHFSHVVWHTDTQVRIFEADWVVGVVAVFVAIALVELLLKRVRLGLPQLLIALVIALALGFASKLGLATHDLPYRF